MSISLMTEAWKSDMPSGRKFVLLSLCDNANDQGECFPSISMIAQRCSMGDRTVQSHIHDLEKMGILSRIERAGRSTIYRIDPRKFAASPLETHYTYRIEDPDSGEFYIGMRTCRGDAKTDGYMGSGAWFQRRVSDGRALRKVVLSVFADRASAAADEKARIESSISDPLCMNQRTPADSAPRKNCTPQISHPTPADFAPITIKEPSIEPKGNPKSSALACPSDVPRQVWDDFLSIRKAKRSPLTSTALEGMRAEAVKAGMTLEGAMSMCCMRGWVGFKSSWLDGIGTSNKPQQARNSGRHAGFSSLDYTAGINDDGSFD